MGSALLLMTAVIDEGASPDWEAAATAVEAWEPRLLSEDEFRQAVNALPALEEYDAQGPEAADQLEEIRNVLRSALELVKGAVEADGDAALTWITVRGAKVWIAGGSSWGDSPSESFDALWRLEATGILAAAGFE